MKLKIFKLVNGEELIGEVDDFQEYALKNPVAIVIQRGPDGKPAIGLAPWPMHAEMWKKGDPDREFFFGIEHVLYSYPPAQDFQTNYEAIFGSGIVMPAEKKLILG